MRETEKSVLLRTVHEDFAIFVRTTCVFNKGSEDEFGCIETLSRWLFRLNHADWQSPTGQSELTMYIAFLEREIKEGVLQKCPFNYIFGDQVSNLQKVVRAECLSVS